METRQVPETIQRKAQQKSNHHQPGTVHFKRKPEYKKKIYIGRNHLMQAYSIQYKMLKKDKQSEADNIFYKRAQCSFTIVVFLICLISYLPVPGAGLLLHKHIQYYKNSPMF